MNAEDHDAQAQHHIRVAKLHGEARDRCDEDGDESMAEFHKSMAIEHTGEAERHLLMCKTARTGELAKADSSLASVVGVIPPMPANIRAIPRPGSPQELRVEGTAGEVISKIYGE